MPTLAVVLAMFLIVLGGGGYAGSRMASPTALIPAGFGLVFLLLGWVAIYDAARKHAMHAAALLALVGTAATARGLMKLPTLLWGGEVARPLAVVSQSAMCLACGLFLIAAIKSFVDARRRRAAAES